MPRRVSPVLLCWLFAAPASATAQQVPDITIRPVEPPCLTTDDDTNCVRLLACVGRSGRWFRGTALGRGTGPLSGRINDGVACTGDWTSRNRLGLGQADVACDDGMSASVYFYYQDEYTGTATGRGLSNRGDLITSFSGEHVLDYLTPDGRRHAVLPCGRDGIELDDEGMPIS